jgi:hypothetical protein
VHGTPLLVVVGLDGKSFRVFIRRIDGQEAEFFLKGETAGETPAAANADASVGTKSASPADCKTTASAPQAATSPTPSKGWALLDTATASEWNFQGCAVSGAAQGKCLDRVPALKDYWFDWRNYHPDTSIYKH